MKTLTLLQRANTFDKSTGEVFNYPFGEKMKATRLLVEWCRTNKINFMVNGEGYDY